MTLEKGTMRAVRFIGNGKTQLDEVATPQPHGTEVVVRVMATSICGTDRENLIGQGQKTVPGHESAGVVVGVDKAVRVSVGDRVAINCHVTCGECEHCRNGDLFLCERLSVIGFDRDGGYADCVLIPESCCMHIPESISFEQAALMVDMLGTPYQAFKRAGISAGDAIAIWGAGPIGLSLLMVATRHGARAAIVDKNEYRLRMSLQFKPDLSLNPDTTAVVDTLKRWTGRKGIKAGFDCVGDELVCLQALDSLAPRGILVVVGVGRHLTIDPWQHLICRELSVLGTRNFNTKLFNEIMGEVLEGMPILSVVTHRFPLDRAVAAFELFKGADCGKILIVEDRAGSGRNPTRKV
jgi:threonine dehydrogenase-like Zn-dependent dehydrogenase